MTAERSLSGRRVLLTRSEEDCADWARTIERRGGEPVLLPCIRTEMIERPGLRGDLNRAVAAADWIVFTSRRGVDAFALLCDRALRRATRVAVVGATTAKAARAKAGRADVVGPGTGAALAKQLVTSGAVEAGANVLIAVAENAGDALERTLAAAGARCTRLDLYRTVSAPPLVPKRRSSALGAKLVVLASPSAASGFVNQVEIDSPVEIYTIGPSTSDAARALGLRVTAEAREPSLEGILETMQ